MGLFDDNDGGRGYSGPSDMALAAIKVYTDDILIDTAAIKTEPIPLDSLSADEITRAAWKRIKKHEDAHKKSTQPFIKEGRKVYPFLPGDGGYQPLKGKGIAGYGIDYKEIKVAAKGFELGGVVPSGSDYGITHDDRPAWGIEAGERDEYGRLIDPKDPALVAVAHQNHALEIAGRSFLKKSKSIYSNHRRKKMEGSIISVHTDKEKVLVGADFHTLKDHTQIGMVTSDMDSFLAYLGKQLDPQIFYNEETCTAWPEEIDQYTNPIAECGLKVGVILESLVAADGRKMALREFEKFLRSMLPYAIGDHAATMLAHTMDFKLQKITDISENKDQQGNFHYSVTRKAGTDQFTPPEKLIFSVPIFFPNDEDKVELVFDLEFHYQEASDEVRISFSMECLTLGQDIFKARKATMEKLLSKFDHKYWGKVVREKKTDEWQYKKNSPEIQSL